MISVRRAKSPLAVESSIVIQLELLDHERHLQIPSRTRYGQVFILDRMATLVGTQLLPRSAPKLRRAAALLEPRTDRPSGRSATDAPRADLPAPRIRSSPG